MQNFVYGAETPTINHAAALDQLRKAHRYRNLLCEIERDRRVAVEEAVRIEFPGIREYDQLIAELDGQICARAKEINETNAANRRRSTTPEQRTELAALRARMKELRATQKEMRNASFDCETVKAIEAASHARFLEARDACQVYWGTYQRVEQAAEGFRKGAPPEFESYRGKGSLGVQIQNGMPFEQLLAGTPSTQLQLHHKIDRHYDLWFRIGTLGAAATAGQRKTDPIWCVIPITLHRVPPPGTLIKTVAVMRRVIGREFFINDKRHCHGGRVEWSVMFTCATSVGVASSSSLPMVGVDVGARIFETEAGKELRVAVAIGQDGVRRELRLEPRDLAAVAKAKTIQGYRDNNFNVIVAELLKWKQSGVELPEWFTEQSSTLELWKSKNRLARLTLLWRDLRIAGDEAIFSAMEAWRQRDNHLARYETGLISGMSKRREHKYRNWIAELRKVYGSAAVEAMDLQKLTATPKAEEEDATCTQVRSQMRLASIGKLREWLKEKLLVLPVEAAYTTLDCSFCGHRNAFDAAANLRHVCTGCGEEWDQDDNAARNLLARGLVALREREERAAAGAVDGAPKKMSRSERFAAARQRRSDAAKKAAEDKKKAEEGSGE